jgi:hypothetical protein
MTAGSIEVQGNSGDLSLPGNQFAGCGSLANIILREGIEEIGDYAFRGTHLSIFALPLPLGS